MTAAILNNKVKLKTLEPVWFDLPLLVMVLALLAVGFIMVSSASMPFADSENYRYNPYHFVI